MSPSFVVIYCSIHLKRIATCMRIYLSEWVYGVAGTLFTTIVFHINIYILVDLFRLIFLVTLCVCVCVCVCGRYGTIPVEEIQFVFTSKSSNETSFGSSPSSFDVSLRACVCECFVASNE